MRVVTGYRLTSLRLERRTVLLSSPAPDVTRIAKAHAQTVPTAPGVNFAWFDQNLTPLPNRGQPEPRLAERMRLYGQDALLSMYVWNRNFLMNQLCSSEPDQGDARFERYRDFFVFTPPQGDVHPRFRFYPGVTYPTGLVTNRFGWRGPEVASDPAPRTIRIAFVGASTTVNYHAMPFSYPEYVGHWLNMWASQARLPVRFETINAGREGIASTDIAAVVRDELLPVRPDIVVYYEGANQFWPGDFVEWPGNRLPPKPTLTFPRPHWIVDYSAIASSASFLTSAGRQSSGVELSRRLGRVRWPETLNEQDPDLAHPQLPVNLPTILKDFESIRRSLQGIGSELFPASFVWLPYDGMVLDPTRHRWTYDYLNVTFWPFPYRHMRRMADFQNRVFAKYAASHTMGFVDIARFYPRDPELFDDAVHMNEAGVRLFAWIVVQQLVPELERRIARGVLPKDRGASPATAADGGPVVTPALLTRADIDRECAVRRAVPATAPQTVFRLDPVTARRVLTLGTAGTRLHDDPGTVRVTSDVSQFHYQLISPVVDVDPGREYVVTYAIEVTRGRMMLGVLDVPADKWLVRRRIEIGKGGSQAVAFACRCDKVRVILTNDNEAPATSEAVVREIRVNPVAR